MYVQTTLYIAPMYMYMYVHVPVCGGGGSPVGGLLLTRPKIILSVNANITYMYV